MTAAALYLSVLMPAYNEEAGLTYAVEVVARKLEALGISFEILIVDDASTDQTGLLADSLATKSERVRVFHHAVNREVGGGFLTGIREARGEFMILIPADLAMDLDDLPKYLAAALEADIVIGICRVHTDYTFFRRIVHMVNIRLIQILFEVKESQFQYISLYRLSVLRKMTIEYWRSAFFHAEVIIKAKVLGWRATEVEINYVPRTTGRATGARWRAIIRTVRDIFHFWLRWLWFGPEAVSGQQVNI